MRIHQKRIIILDDDSLHNIIAILSIKKILSDSSVDIIGFTNPLEGLSYIKTEYTDHPAETILLLDINMPEMTGWQVLDELNAMPYIIKWFSIYILSSSVHERDIVHANQTKLVKAYLEKPLLNHLKFLFPPVEELIVV